MKWLVHSFAMTALITLAGDALGQTNDAYQADEACEDQGGRERELGQHRFVIPSELDHAFMVSALAFDQGFGVLTAKGADLDGKLFLLRERFRLQLGIGNRFALEASADARAGVAGNADTLLVLAGAAELELAVGPKARLFTLPDVGLQVSAGVSFKPTLSYAVSPAAAVEAESAKHLLQKQDASFIQPGLMAAWGRGALGVQVELRPAISTNSANGPSQIESGAAVGLDFGALTERSVPLAFQVEYGFDKDVDGSEPEHELTSGLFYSGNRDLQLGLRFTRIVGDPTQTLHFGTLNLGYFF